MWQVLRSVIQNNDVSRQVDQNADAFNRFNEAWQALEWLLARTPDIGIQNTEHEGKYWLYVQAGDSLAGTPEISVVYSFTSSEVTLYSIRVVAQQPTPNS